jgi:16S rRNA (cytidine1402-2'-O)-methyltransferase
MPLNLPIHEPKNIVQGGTLYIVSTPIGNLEDITLRALNVLGAVDFIAAEDTRHTGKLLAHHGIRTHLISYHEYNEQLKARDIIRRLVEGASIALVTDAGTPSVSDPGYRLVNAAITANIRVIPIPGVSAAITALSASGLPTDSFIFVGFAAKKKGKRLEQLKALSEESRTLIFYESPKRMIDLLIEIQEVMGDRYTVLCREMTKRHEEFLRGKISEIVTELNTRDTVKGECTILITGSEEGNQITDFSTGSELEAIIREAISDGGSLSDVARQVSRGTGRPRREIYELALKMKLKLPKRTV